MEVLAVEDKVLSEATSAVAIWRNSQNSQTTTTFDRFTVTMQNAMIFGELGKQKRGSRNNFKTTESR